jgi:hypothetical protein
MRASCLVHQVAEEWASAQPSTDLIEDAHLVVVQLHFDGSNTGCVVHVFLLGGAGFEDGHAAGVILCNRSRATACAQFFWHEKAAGLLRLGFGLGRVAEDDRVQLVSSDLTFELGLNLAAALAGDGALRCPFLDCLRRQAKQIA